MTNHINLSTAVTLRVTYAVSIGQTTVRGFKVRLINVIPRYLANCCDMQKYVEEPQKGGINTSLTFI